MTTGHSIERKGKKNFLLIIGATNVSNITAAHCHEQTVTGDAGMVQ